MSSELPFPISFALPEGWTLVPPESCGRPDAAYVAIRQQNASEPVATNIIVNGFAKHGQSVDLAALADAYLAGLRAQYPVTILRRDVMTDGSVAEAAQLLQIEYPADGFTMRLNQIHIINAFPGATDAAATAVLQLLMTCPADVFDQAGPEFGQFVATISPLQSEPPTQ